MCSGRSGKTTLDSWGWGRPLQARTDPLPWPTLPSLLPPPAPFKIFVLLAGVANIRVRQFTLAIAIGRGLRSIEGFDEMHLGRAGVRETDVDTAGGERPQQRFGAVHCVIPPRRPRPRATARTFVLSVGW